ncbi:hypothetical protein QRL15_003864 [Vibrio parahaemolyticus]|nr:hypothetical protein [Vibrio parahaemolyticus]ETJ84791.1 hypothetical protein D029_4827 [Vibrio parahaemolyticus 970107]
MSLLRLSLLIVVLVRPPHRRKRLSDGSNVFQWDYTPLVLKGSARLILAG